MSDLHDLTAASWRKSSHSGGQGECVEIAPISDIVVVRDSKNVHGAKLAVSAAAFQRLIQEVRHGDHDL
ncbi:DUF397 domain-containing protein [Actinomadura adrarensis]|uniref:DUF397 domain-containing protein n=1 Tax=Actinomadura adrarensis TaxID=1819600 RepID=A0ABW3CBY7_9ACTN